MGHSFQLFPSDMKHAAVLLLICLFGLGQSWTSQSSDVYTKSQFLQKFSVDNFYACKYTGRFVEARHCAVFHCSWVNNRMHMGSVSQWFAPAHFEDWCKVVSDRVGSEYEDQSDADIIRCFRQAAICGHDHTGKSEVRMTGK